MSYSRTALEAQIDRIATELDEIRRLADICDEVRYLPSLAGSGGPGAGGVRRPTEDAACDPARLAVVVELATAYNHMTSAAAYVSGTATALDRALSMWEGRQGADDGSGNTDGGPGGGRA